MSVRALIQAKEVRDDGSIVEIVVWELAAPLPPCRHNYKYRMFFGMPGICWVRSTLEARLLPSSPMVMCNRRSPLIALTVTVARV
jgi:hypothetical protein